MDPLYYDLERNCTPYVFNIYINYILSRVCVLTNFSADILRVKNRDPRLASSVFRTVRLISMEYNFAFLARNYDLCCGHILTHRIRFRHWFRVGLDAAHLEAVRGWHLPLGVALSPALYPALHLALHSALHRASRRAGGAPCWRLAGPLQLQVQRG